MNRRTFFGAFTGAIMAIAGGSVFPKGTWEGTRLPKGTAHGITETAYLELAAMEKRMKRNRINQEDIRVYRYTYET